MKAKDFIVENMDNEALASIAQKYLNKLLGKDLVASSAINQVVDVLVTRGVDHSLAADVTKQAYAKITGSNFIS